MADSVSGVSSTDTYTISQHMQDFKDGIVNFSKEDLKSNITELLEERQTPSSTIIDLYESYDEIDQNGDGISYEEFKTYQASPQGIINSLGLSSRADYTSTIASTLLNAGSSANNSYFSSILNAYTGSNYTPRNSLADYMV